MKILITGGNKGLGLELKKVFNADSLTRAETGTDITKDQDLIAKKSLDYDVFINNAFDGPPQETWANFAQSTLLIKTFEKWKENNKEGWIFNIGSIASDDIVSPDPNWETYRVSKKALEHASAQCSRAFRKNIVKFRTVLIKPDRLDTPLSRSRDTWTGNGISTTSISDFIQYCFTLPKNTQIDSITFGLNYNHETK